MKKPVNPIVLIVITAAAVVVLALWGYHAMQPSDYMPSPGVAGRPPHNPDYMQPAANGPQTPGQASAAQRPSTAGR